MTLATSQSENDAAASYRGLIADFLVAHSFRQDHGGYLAFEGELIAGGTAMQVDRKVLVDVEAVLCERHGAERIKPVPSLWFSVDNEGAPFNSFAIETERLIEELENGDPSVQRPILAVEAHDPYLDRVVGGDRLYVRITPLRIEPAPEATEPRLPADGICFQVGKTIQTEEGQPAYSFAMAGLTPMLALSAALAQYSGPSASLRVDELRKQMERAGRP